MLLETLILAAAVVGLVLLGRTGKERDTQAEVLNDIDKANRARDRLVHDADFAQRLRTRFTRGLL